MANYTLWEELGIEIPEEETKKAEPKKAAKKDTKKSNSKKPAEKKEDKLNFPLTVLTGICPPTVISKEQADGAETLEKISEFICKQTGIPHELTVAKKITNNKVAVVYNLARVQAKGEFDITPASVVVIGEERIALAEIEGKRTPKEINDFIEKQTGEKVPYRFIVGDERLYAIPGENVAVGMVSLPVTVKNPLGHTEDIVLNASDFDDIEEGAEEIQVDDVLDMVAEMEAFKDLDPILALSRPSEPTDKNTLFVTLKFIVRSTSSITSTKQTYPTNAVISMLFNRIQLTPEMFGGRERVEEADIVAFLSKDYPEFTPARTRLTYDKEGNYIFPALKSSSKGAVTYGSREECLAAAAEHEIYFLANYMEKGVEVRYEKTPISVVEASADKAVGRFQWKLPKIPMFMLDGIERFFSYVTIDFGTEALVQICYNTKGKSYYVWIPEQKVSKTEVTTDEMVISTSEVYHVMDIHSHNTMGAFFSNKDNLDEKANRVYGVMGCLDKEPTEMKFRAATGGKFVDVEASELFEDDHTDYGYYFAQELYENWLSVVRIA